MITNQTVAKQFNIDYNCVHQHGRRQLFTVDLREQGKGIVLVSYTTIVGKFTSIKITKEWLKHGHATSKQLAWFASEMLNAGKSVTYTDEPFI